jgi:hypothetical protein
MVGIIIYSSFLLLACVFLGLCAILLIGNGINLVVMNVKLKREYRSRDKLKTQLQLLEQLPDSRETKIRKKWLLDNLMLSNTRCLQIIAQH